MSLASCGGNSGSDGYLIAVDAANAKQAEAISLALASPCDAVQQCANLALVQANGHCSAASYRPYSLASTTAAAASAAAADERVLADQAIALAPPPVIACTMRVVAPPGLACVANTCQAVAPAQ